MDDSSALKPWQQLERTITEIIRQISPLATVEHNAKVTGLSGRERQIDVLATETFGIVPVKIVFECKCYERPVTIDKIDGFGTKLGDVRANVGVMISTSGFDEGARAQAERLGIQLLTCREADETDWSRVFSPEAWLSFVQRDTHFSNLQVHALASRQDFTPDIEATLWRKEDNAYVPTRSIKSIMIGLVTEQVRLPLGVTDLQYPFDQEWYVKVEDDYFQVTQIDFRVTTRAFATVVNVEFQQGNVLERSTDSSHLTSQLVGKGIELPKVADILRGSEVNQEQLESILARGSKENSFELPLSYMDEGSLVLRFNTKPVPLL